LDALMTFQPKMEDYLSWALLVASDFTKRDTIRSEEYADALFGLWEACKGYTGSSPDGFKHYARRCMRNRILQSYRQKRTVETGLDMTAYPVRQPTSSEEPVGCQLGLLNPSPNDSRSVRIGKKLLRLHIIKNQSYAAIARRRGRTRAWASQCAEKALAKIRSKMIEAEKASTIR